LYYIRGIARNRCGYFSEWQALDYLKAARSWNISLNYLSDIAKRITSWTQFKDEISNAIDEVKKTEEGADDENTFIITLSKDDAELLKEQAGFVEMTPEEIVKNSVLNNIQPTTERLKKYWLDFYINPHDKEDFRFNISDRREEHSQYGYEYSHEMEKVKHFWGEYNSLDFIAADILMFANEIYAHSYLGEIEKFGGHEDIDRVATYLQNYWEKNDDWGGICFISKEPHA
tara:strand:- start:104 stop:793 length:690 start_codon:yes stop_codon:yes gene_type:complete